MARPRDDSKREAILAAAAQSIAEHGLAAPTARIASTAGIAEGSLFIYFSTKDDLLNQLYLALKSEMRTDLLTGFPAAAPLEQRARHVWQRLLARGAANPVHRRALAQLSVSDRITPETRHIANCGFEELSMLLTEMAHQGPLRDLPAAFVSAIFLALADTTIDAIATNRRRARILEAAGFQAMWQAIAIS